MATFTPPVDASGDPPVLPVGDPGQSPGAYRLMRWYRSRPVGRNVYVYKTGSVSATAFGRVTEIDPVTTYNSSGVMTSNGWQDIQVIFWGGHVPQTVDATMAALLTTAGYAANLS